MPFVVALLLLRVVRRHLLDVASLRLVNALSMTIAVGGTLPFVSWTPPPILLALMAAKTFTSALQHHLSRRHMDAATMLLSCAASSQIITAWFLRPDTLHASYASFLTRQSGLSRASLRACANYRTVPVADFSRLVRTDYAGQPAGRVLSPARFVLAFVALQLRKSSRLYLATYLLVALRQLFVQRRHTGGADVARRYALNVARSTLFLAAYCTGGIVALLVADRLCRTAASAGGSSSTVTLARFYALNWMCGLALFIEPASRRLTVATYIATHALHSIVAQHNMHKSSSSPTPQLLLFVACSAALAYYFDQQPAAVSSWLLDLHSA